MTTSILDLTASSPPLLYLLFAVLAFIAPTVRSSWSLAYIGVTSTLLLALLRCVSREGDLLGSLMITLISFLGWIIVSYSRTYLDGESCQRRYIAALLSTLATVSVIALSDNLLTIGIAWTATSFCLHLLLTLYPERSGALLAAHKKFIASRIADLAYLLALALIVSEGGTLQISELNASVEGAGQLSGNLHIAAVFIVGAVILRSAQIPVHGWLMQVMEAPTPVSALLHAGVINIGGFVLLRLSPLLSQAPLAQTLLVVVGSLSAVIAGVVMMTRISIKVRLAWSTCAQLGFMLMECGLGLYSLAFLHLLSHSCYKAYLFLSAGETVVESRRRRLYTSLTSSHSTGRALAVAEAMMLTTGLFLVSELLVPSLHLPLPIFVIVGLAVAPFMWDRGVPAWSRTLRILSVVGLYVVGHLLLEPLFTSHNGPSIVLTLVVITFFTILYTIQEEILTRPDGSFSQNLYRWAFAGFYLDEWFTRATFKLWPVHLLPHRERRMGVRPREAFAGEEL